MSDHRHSNQGEAGIIVPPQLPFAVRHTPCRDFRQASESFLIPIFCFHRNTSSTLRDRSGRSTLFYEDAERFAAEHAPLKKGNYHGKARAGIDW